MFSAHSFSPPPVQARTTLQTIMACVPLLLTLACADGPSRSPVTAGQDATVAAIADASERPDVVVSEDAASTADAAPEDAASEDGTSADVDSTPDAAIGHLEGGAPADTGAGEDASGPELTCPAAGIYGPCSTTPGCNCLRGATVYQFCTATCSTTADCGDPAAVGGAIAGCFPINPGAAQKICALVCTADSDCPCGLVCTPSGLGATKICAELQ